MAILIEKGAGFRRFERERERKMKNKGGFSRQKDAPGEEPVDRFLNPVDRFFTKPKKFLGAQEPGDRLPIRSSVSPTGRPFYHPIDRQRRCKICFPNPVDRVLIRSSGLPKKMNNPSLSQKKNARNIMQIMQSNLKTNN